MDIHTKKNRSLIMCTTPLQMLIANRIIQENSDEIFDLILIVNGEINNKFKYYFNGLSEICAKVLCIELNYISGLNKINKLFEFKKEYIGWGDFNYSSYYLASIDNTFFHWILSKKKESSSIFTFDDGVANIFYKSSFFVKKSITWRLIVWKFIGVYFNINKVKEQSKLHYTIYPNKKNIIENKKNISLFIGDFIRVKSNEDEEINLFLGQPLYEINKKYNENYLCNLLKKLNIDLYFPHPREKYNLDTSISIVNSELIFEDYVVNLLSNNKKINIFTFLSTAALNVENISGIKINYLFDDFLMENYREFYFLAEFGLNSHLINVE